MEPHKSAGNVGWAAGFIDADGSISISQFRRKPADAYRAVLQGSNRDLRPLEKLQALFGGTITLSKQANSWNDGSRRAPFYIWRCSAATLRPTLALLIPRLVIKREQAELMHNFLSAGTRGKRITPAEDERRRICHSNMKALNARERYYEEARI